MVTSKEWGVFFFFVPESWVSLIRPQPSQVQGYADFDRSVRFQGRLQAQLSLLPLKFSRGLLLLWNSLALFSSHFPFLSNWSLQHISLLLFTIPCFSSESPWENWPFQTASPTYTIIEIPSLFATKYFKTTLKYVNRLAFFYLIIYLKYHTT